MNGFTENRAHGASERPGRDDEPMTWGASSAMLPLVGRVALDVQRHHQRLARLRPELARLERARLKLAWPQRSRRYQLQEEIVVAQAEFRTAVAELERLGVALLDAGSGLVGFPTVVDDRRAFFSWQPGEESLGYWNFADDTERRPVQSDWTRPAKPARARKSRRDKR